MVSEQPPLEGGATAAAEARLRPSARHVLGVAFPYTDAGEARGFELECSFLQLAYSVYRLRSGRYDAVGYFAVLSQELRDAVSRLKARYQAGDAVHIVFTSLLISDMTTLAEAAERASAEGDPSILVTVGRQIAADTLCREIALREPDAVVGTGEDAPFGLPWDYHGMVRRPAGQSTVD